MGPDPRDALRRLRAAAEDGRLEALCRRHGGRVLTVLGSTARLDGRPRDLDTEPACSLSGR